MNPKEFWWTEDQQVTVVNPTDEVYRFKVHSKDYQIGPKKSAKMPGYIAWVYVYGLASKLCQADDNFIRWNEEGYRKEYYEKLTNGVDDIVQEVQEAPESEVQELEEGDLPVQEEPVKPKVVKEQPKTVASK